MVTKLAKLSYGTRRLISYGREQRRLCPLLQVPASHEWRDLAGAEDRHSRA